MIKKHYYSWADVEKMCVSIVNQMYKDNWRPDYIVGITRGGNIPATIISNMTGIRCEALKVSLRDDVGSVSDAAMAEDAYEDKKILIVDDINDTGATFEWIKQDWPAGCYPGSAWENIWGHNVRFATLTENLASNFDKVTYTCHEVNKAEEDVWLVYPWENVADYA
tara:strand:- start:194 stop:691 length:498 start_codon:yes stop_codon:yes gene_type:complete